MPRRCSSVACLVAATLVAGCGSASAWVRGVAPLNRNEANESTPVDVRFYQLANEDAFVRATFESLWVDASKALGGDLLAPPVVATVVPGARNDQPVEIKLGKLDSKTKRIGVMALFRRTDGADRRLLVIPVDRIGKEIIELTGYSVALSADGPSAPAGKAADSTPTPAEDTPSGGSPTPTHQKGGRRGG